MGMDCCAAGFKGREGEMCDGYRTWEEEFYWKRFKHLQFCQILGEDTEFHKQLFIPRKFANNAKANLPAKVTLRGPSGASWNAIITTMGKDLFLSDGWEEFAEAHSLQTNTILIFKYDGVSIFDVLVFDGENLCEMESAYFVKKCGHVDHSIERKRKRLPCEVDVEENDDAPIQKATKQAREEVGKKAVDESPRKLRNIKSRLRSNAVKEKLVQRKATSSKASPAEKVPIEASPLSVKKVSGIAKVTRNIASTRGRRKKGVGARGRKKASIARILNENSTKKVASVDGLATEMGAAGGADDIPFGSPQSSNRMYVSEEGKMALERARKEMTESSFVLVMRPTSVYRRFLVTVPPAFHKMHLAPKSQDAFLRIGDKTWLTKLTYSASKATGQICGGWRQFALDNQLKQFDVCLFSLVSQNEDSAMLDVGIFRAGSAEPVPLRQVMADPSIRAVNGVQ